MRLWRRGLRNIDAEIGIKGTVGIKNKKKYEERGVYH
jgi:hypothetical protein